MLRRLQSLTTFFSTSQLFMQDPNRTSTTRKPWYKKAIENTLWKTLFRSQPWITKTTTTTTATTNTTFWKSFNTTEFSNTSSNSSKGKLRKSSSLKVATSFTRVCLCAPIASYSEVFTTDVPPRRSYSYPRSSFTKPLPTNGLHVVQHQVPSARPSVERRRVFRGKSLMDDVLMKRFVVEEVAMMQVRRRNEMEIARRRVALRRRKLGPSPLSRMVIAENLVMC